MKFGPNLAHMDLTRPPVRETNGLKSEVGQFELWLRSRWLESRNVLVANEWATFLRGVGG